MYNVYLNADITLYVLLIYVGTSPRIINIDLRY